MFIKKIRLFVPFIMLSIFVVSPVLAQPQSIGKVIAVRGRVTAKQGGVLRTLSRGSNLMVGDEIQTGVNSTARLRLSDQSILQLQESTFFSLKKYHYNPKVTQSNRFVARLLRGQLRTLTGVIAKKNRRGYRFEVGPQDRQPIAVIGVRGTEFEVFYRRGVVRVLLMSGQIDVNGYVLSRRGQLIQLDSAGRRVDNPISSNLPVTHSLNGVSGEVAFTGGLGGAPGGAALGSTSEVTIIDTSGGGNNTSFPMSIFTQIAEPASVAAGGQALNSQVAESGDITLLSH